MVNNGNNHLVSDGNTSLDNLLIRIIMNRRLQVVFKDPLRARELLDMSQVVSEQRQSDPNSYQNLKDIPLEPKSPGEVGQHHLACMLDDRCTAGAPLLKKRLDDHFNSSNDLNLPVVALLNPNSQITPNLENIKYVSILELIIGGHIQKKDTVILSDDLYSAVRQVSLTCKSEWSALEQVALSYVDAERERLPVLYVTKNIKSSEELSKTVPGYRFTVASSIADACTAVATNRFRAVVIDGDFMPGEIQSITAGNLNYTIYLDKGSIRDVYSPYANISFKNRDIHSVLDDIMVSQDRIAHDEADKSLTLGSLEKRCQILDLWSHYHSASYLFETLRDIIFFLSRNPFSGQIHFSENSHILQALKLFAKAYIPVLTGSKEFRAELDEIYSNSADYLELKSILRGSDTICDIFEMIRHRTTNGVYSINPKYSDVPGLTALTEIFVKDYVEVDMAAIVGQIEHYLFRRTGGSGKGINPAKIFDNWCYIDQDGIEHGLALIHAEKGISVFDMLRDINLAMADPSVTSSEKASLQELKTNTLYDILHRNNLAEHLIPIINKTDLAGAIDFQYTDFSKELSRLFEEAQLYYHVQFSEEERRKIDGELKLIGAALSQNPQLMVPKRDPNPRQFIVRLEPEIFRRLHDDLPEKSYVSLDILNKHGSHIPSAVLRDIDWDKCKFMTTMCETLDQLLLFSEVNLGEAELRRLIVWSLLDKIELFYQDNPDSSQIVSSIYLEKQRIREDTMYSEDKFADADKFSSYLADLTARFDMKIGGVGLIQEYFRTAKEGAFYRNFRSAINRTKRNIKDLHLKKAELLANPKPHKELASIEADIAEYTGYIVGYLEKAASNLECSSNHDVYSSLVSSMYKIVDSIKKDGFKANGDDAL